MADLRVKKADGDKKPAGSGKIVVPLWPFLLLILLLIPAVMFWWPHPEQETVSYFNPVTGQNQVLTYEGRRLAPVPNAPGRQVVADPQNMQVVGRADDQLVYAPRRGEGAGGGGGTEVPPQGLYLRSGNDLFVPLREVPANQGATTP